MKFELMACPASVDQIAKSQVYTAGTSAVYDAFTHMLPCKVLEVIEEGDGCRVTSGKLRIRLTEDRGPYKKGEEMEVTGYHTIPRDRLYVSGYHERINPWYRWVIKQA